MWRSISLIRVSFIALILTAVDSQAITVTIYATPETCGQGNGGAEAYVSGGTPPYSYSWSNGSTTSTISGLSAGTYSVTVLDALGEQAQNSATVTNNTSFMVPQPSQLVNGIGGHPCWNSCNGTLVVLTNAINGTPPYFVNINGHNQIGTDDEGRPVFDGFCQNEVAEIFVSDANGCSGYTTFTVVGPPDPDLQLLSISPACANDPNGSVTFSWTNSVWPYLQLQILDSNEDLLSYENIFSADTFVVDSLLPGAYTARLLQTIATQPCYEEVSFNVGSIPGCGNLSGNLFLDTDDQNCSLDAGEPAIPNKLIEILPGPHYAITNSEGNFSMNLDLGDYTAQVINSPELVQLCPPGFPVPFSLTAGEPDQIIQFADSSSYLLDMQAEVVSGPARPGFVFHYWIHLNEVGGRQSDLMDVSFDFGPILTFLNSNIPISGMNGNTLNWQDLAAVDPFSSLWIHLTFQVPADITLIGTVLSATLSIEPNGNEVVLNNNSASLNTTVTASYDPNDKLVTTISNEEGSFIIGQDEWLEYTIRFQNTGTDTAFNVLVTDTLSLELDMSTFQQGVASHPFEVIFKPGRVIEWRFENILLPDSNVNEAASHGLVSFRIRPHLPIAPGTEIENVANIFFDFNEPVITEPCVLVATISTAIGTENTDLSDRIVFPQPTAGVFEITGLDPSVELKEIRIHSIDGRSVLMESILPDQRQFNAGRLPNGRYIVELIGSDGPIVRKPLQILR